MQPQCIMVSDMAGVWQILAFASLALLANGMEERLCWFQQEPDPARHNEYRWLIPEPDPCLCTKVDVSGLSTHTPLRPFAVTYHDGFFTSSDPDHIQQQLGCPDACTPNPCQNEGTCESSLSSLSCICKEGFIGELCEAIVSSPYFCQGKTVSGVYRLSEPNTAYNGQDVYCDVERDGSAWLVFQRRVDNSTDFYRDHQSYEEGFGEVTGNFWLGNGLVHHLTSMGQWALKVDLMDWNDTTAYAQYDHFALGPAPQFTLDVTGYNGTAGDSLAFHNGMGFTTKDYDMDAASGGNCAIWLNGAWWYNFCHRSALNALYLSGGGVVKRDQGIQWVSWKGYYYSMKSCQLKIRPLF